MDWTAILIGAAIGNLIGGAITFLVSWIFYVGAAKGLQRQTELIMRGLEEGLQVKYNRNEQGEVVGIEIKLNGTVGAGGSVSGTLTVGDQDDAPGDQDPHP